MSLFGSEDDETSSPERREIGSGVLNTPLTKDILERAKAEEIVNITDNDAPLIELVEDIQEFIDDHEYDADTEPEYERMFEELPGEVESVGHGRNGNAFVDWLWYQCSEQNLIEARKITGSALFFVATEEVWAYIVDELNFSTSEAKAARNVHNLFAAESGLAASIGHSLMAINASHDRLRRFEGLEFVDSEDFHESEYEAERRQN